MASSPSCLNSGACDWSSLKWRWKTAFGKGLVGQMSYEGANTRLHFFSTDVGEKSMSDDFAGMELIIFITSSSVTGKSSTCDGPTCGSSYECGSRAVPVSLVALTSYMRLILEQKHAENNSAAQLESIRLREIGAAVLGMQEFAHSRPVFLWPFSHVGDAVGVMQAPWLV